MHNRPKNPAPKKKKKAKPVGKESILESWKRRFSDDPYIDDDSDEEIEKLIPKKFSSRVLKLASESYQVMLDNAIEGDVCIIEECYIIVGIEPSADSLIFSGLQSLVDSERKLKFRESPSITDKRCQFLEKMQSKLILSPDQAEVKYPISELDHINMDRKCHKIQLMGSAISFYLPLPKMQSEFGIAQLMFKFKLRTVLNILMSLLLENSVLIVGTSYEEVTSCSFALIDLLKPYHWANVFIPILPDELFECVSSPVPYIIGIVARDKAHLKEIESDYRVAQHIQLGLNVINVTSGTVQWNEEKNAKGKRLIKASGIISHGFGEGELNRYDQRLVELGENKSSSLNSFKLFFQEGASRKETVTLNSIKTFIERNFTRLSGMISQRNEGWTIYAQKDMTFSSSKFYIPLIRLLEFQKLFSKTQLLSCYYEKKKQLSEARKVNKAQALLVADWTYFNWMKYKRRKETM